jgi:hypothetical protein
MSDLVNPILTDPSVAPTDELISSIVGESMILWNNVLNNSSGLYKDASGSWNYYRDGKQWLFKFVRKKKTLFWAGIYENKFRITFYFGNKVESLVLSSELPADIKDSFRNAKHFGTIRPITIALQELADCENVYKLIDLKNKIK